MFNKTYHATHPGMMAGVSNEQLRERYIVSSLFVDDEINLNYSHNERFVIGGAAPVSKVVTMPVQTVPESAKEHPFLERRELGVINIGNGAGSVAKELGPQGIRVNVLNPGMIATTFHDTFSTPEARRNVEAKVSLRRQGHPDDCADTVVYLALDAASYITGANIDINGGMYYS